MHAPAVVSAPPLCRWDYGVKPQPGSAEADMQAALTGVPPDWCA